MNRDSLLRSMRLFLSDLFAASIAIVLFALFVSPLSAQPPEDHDYHQWKKALGSDQAIEPVEISLRNGFDIELIRSAKKEEGSWVSMAFDSRGRIILGREDKGLLRVTLSHSKKGLVSATEIETVNDSLLECRGLLFAYDALYANANNSKGLYRLKDTNGDDQFDEVKLLRRTEGGVGHGRNDLTLGPDGAIYLIHGNDVRLPEDFTFGNSPLQHFAEDVLLPASWNKQLFNAGALLPAGHVIRTDRDGKRWELIAGGFRNPFGIDFNSDGELFTYDADMEWDVGAPWYRPTRVNHIVSGADFGWRQGTNKWPAFYPDSLPSNLNIGQGSPTAVKFGYPSSFPAKYKNALFILDWAYGRIIAVHMTPHGASYQCRSEIFVKGRPLNVTDLDFGPDGAMYFITGGRKTQSGLYRVRYAGSKTEKTPLTKNQLRQKETATQARKLRRRLESFHGTVDSTAIETAWPHLNSSDRWIRHAARVAIEHQPKADWKNRALGEKKPTSAATALLALARMADKSDQPQLLAALERLDWPKLSTEQKRITLRAYTVCFCRLDSPGDHDDANIARRIDAFYPDQDPRANQMLCSLLVYLKAPSVIQKTLPLLKATQSQEEKLSYLMSLRSVRSPWTMQQRKLYFQTLRSGEDFDGAHYMARFLGYIKTDAEATLSQTEREGLAELLTAPRASNLSSTPKGPARPVVKQWTFQDLAGSLSEVGHGRDYQRGKAMFKAAQCAACHRLYQSGNAIGPDLSDVSRRLSRRDLLISMLEPSKVVAEKYRNIAIETKDGLSVIGKIVAETEEQLTISTDPLDPAKLVEVAKDDIEDRAESLISAMPKGAIDTLQLEEILDLLAFIEAAGDPQHPNFQ